MKALDKASFIGTRHGRLIVESQIESGAVSHTKWLCRCDCGRAVEVLGCNLRSKNTGSCGCGHSEMTTRRNLKHLLCSTRTYRIWAGMKTRCYNPKSGERERYMDRGITACECIKASVKGIIDVIGNAPLRMTLDRIDNEKGYFCGACEDCISSEKPANIRWSTVKDQNRNRSSNRMVTISGVTKCASEWAEQIGISGSTLISRILRGWPEDRLLAAPRRQTLSI